MKELLLVDLSSIAHIAWHTSTTEIDPDATSIKTVQRVRALASNYPHAAICCDSGKSFRAEIDPSYKSQRPEKNEALVHQIKVSIEKLAADGFPIWSVKGLEADDLIASGVAQALKREDVSVVIASSDKDLLALVGERVKVRSMSSGNLFDEAAVIEKFGVRPEQMTDYLSLVGDSSDNIKGAEGIGPKKAAELLKTFPDLDFLYTCLDDGSVGKITPSLLKSLTEFRPRMDLTRSLVRMRTDAPINLDEAFAPRVPKDTDPSFGMEDGLNDDLFGTQDAEPVKPAEAPSAPAAPTGTPTPTATAPPDMALTLVDPAHVIAIPYEKQLDPRSYSDVRVLARDMHDSRMFSGYGTPQAIASAVIVGRELGLPAMVSLRAIYNVEGRHALSAQIMVALILKSGLAEYFRPASFDAKQATWETLRKGEGQKPMQLQHTIEMAQLAGLVKEKSNWIKSPIDMLNARASARLARLIYPDLLAGMYTPEELQEMNA